MPNVKIIRKCLTMMRTPVLHWHVLAFSPLFRPLPPGLWLANVVFQRILGINYDVKRMVHFTTRVVGGAKLDLGAGQEPAFSLAASGGCYLQATNGIKIGSDTMFGPGVKLISANHDLEHGTEAWVADGPVEIGQRCWLGANSIVLAGVKLGDDCVVGAGAVVTKSFPASSVVAGVPAKLLRTREHSEGEVE